MTPRGDQFPMLRIDDDFAKPETVREVDPEDLAAVFGEGGRLKPVTPEIAEEAVAEGQVAGLLSWLEAVKRESATWIRDPLLRTDFTNPLIQLLNLRIFN